MYASITTIECLTALVSSSVEAPLRVMSVIKFDITPISLPTFSFFILTELGVAGYSFLLSKVIRPLSGAVDVMLTPLPVGITITVSPSKSAPDSLSAFFELIQMASLGLVPIMLTASLFLLLTLRIGISKVPPCGYLIKATDSPFLKLGA